MDTAAGAQHHGFKKILHLVRHAQGAHNVAAENNREALMSYDHLDAPLSCLGRQQVSDLRKSVHEHGLFKRIELVITSPMTRTLETAVGVFGSKNLANELDEEKSKVDIDKNQTAISSTLNCIPILAVELCREKLGVQPCNKRRSISNYKSLFQAVDFSSIESEDDNLWSVDYRESNEEVAARGIKFIKWLWTRKETEIAVVSHGIFLQQTLIALGAISYPSVPNGLLNRFRNCELRSLSVNMVNESMMMGFDSLTMGKHSARVEYRLQLPNATIKENGSEMENNKAKMMEFDHVHLGMDFFHNAKAVQLCSHHDKLRLAEEDKESVTQDQNGSSKNARWTVDRAHVRIPVHHPPQELLKQVPHRLQPAFLGWDDQPESVPDPA